MTQMRKGATFIEYALLVGLVAIVVAAAAMFFGQDLKALFGESGQKAQDVAAGVSKVKLTVDAQKGRVTTGDQGSGSGSGSGSGQAGK